MPSLMVITHTVLAGLGVLFGLWGGLHRIAPRSALGAGEVNARVLLMEIQR